MSTIFSPKRADGRAEWRVIFDLAETLEPGDVIAHEDLRDALDTTDMSRVYRAIIRANKELRKTRQRSLGNIQGFGYRMLRANEHELQAEGYSKKARRSQSSAVMVLAGTRLDELTADERSQHLQVERGMRLMLAVLQHHAARLARHDNLLGELQARVERLEGDDN